MVRLARIKQTAGGSPSNSFWLCHEGEGGVSGRDGEDTVGQFCLMNPLSWLTEQLIRVGLINHNLTAIDQVWAAHVKLAQLIRAKPIKRRIFLVHWNGHKNLANWILAYGPKVIALKAGCLSWRAAKPVHPKHPKPHRIPQTPKPKPGKPVHKNYPSCDKLREFFSSLTWKQMRVDCFERHGYQCAGCGRSPKRHGVVLHCDHIIPISIEPARMTDPKNLQPLCEDCNLGKGNRYRTDLR